MESGKEKASTSMLMVTSTKVILKIIKSMELGRLLTKIKDNIMVNCI
jgi:hypothetical protein